MSGITSYCNQTAVRKTPTGYTSASGPTMQITTINVRFEPYTRNMMDAGGKSYTSQARVLTASEVKVGDTLTFATREWPVRNVKMHPALDGTADHYEVIL